MNARCITAAHALAASPYVYMSEEVLSIRICLFNRLKIGTDRRAMRQPLIPGMHGARGWHNEYNKFIQTERARSLPARFLSVDKKPK